MVVSHVPGRRARDLDVIRMRGLGIAAMQQRPDMGRGDDVNRDEQTQSRRRTVAQMLGIHVISRSLEPQDVLDRAYTVGQSGFLRHPRSYALVAYLIHSSPIYRVPRPSASGEVDVRLRRLTQRARSAFRCGR